MLSQRNPGAFPEQREAFPKGLEVVHIHLAIGNDDLGVYRQVRRLSFLYDPVTDLKACINIGGANVVPHPPIFLGINDDLPTAHL